MAIEYVDGTTLDSNLTSIANAIRTKGGTSASLLFPTEFVSAINAIQTGGGGSATLITKNITANGTYNASSDSADGYSSVSVAVPSGAVIEQGTWEPSSNTSGSKISFSNSHTDAPCFVFLSDVTGTADTNTNTNMMFVWFDYYKMWGQGIPWSASAWRYAVALYTYRASNTGNLATGAVHCAYNSDNTGDGSINYPRFWCDNTGFTPNSASTDRYWRTGRTYKWIAIWKP